MSAPILDFDGDARVWVRILARYRQPHLGRGIFEPAITLGAFIVSWLAMWFALKISYALCLLLATAGFLVRLFMIQHSWCRSAQVAG